MTAIYIWPAVCSYHSTIETSRCLFRRSFSAPKTNAAHCRKDLIIAKWRRQIFQGKYSSQSRYNSPKRSYVNINILCVGCIRLYGLVPQSSRWYIISTHAAEKGFSAITSQQSCSHMVTRFADSQVCVRTFANKLLNDTCRIIVYNTMYKAETQILASFNRQTLLLFGLRPTFRGTLADTSWISFGGRQG